MTNDDSESNASVLLEASIAVIEKALIQALEAKDFDAADALLDILRALDGETAVH